MMFGHETILPVDLLLRPNDVQCHTNISNFSYIHNLKQNMAKIHDLAREKLLEASDNQKRQYDMRSYTNNYKQRDRVFVFDPSLCQEWG